MQALLGGPEVTGSIPSQGTKITHEVRRGQKKKKCNPEAHWPHPRAQEPRTGIFLVDQWLRLQVLNARGLGFIPGQGTRSHMPQLRPGTVK